MCSPNEIQTEYFKHATNYKAGLNNALQTERKEGAWTSAENINCSYFKRCKWGAFFFDIWLFVPKCLKNTVKKVFPLWFFIPCQVPLELPSPCVTESMLGSEETVSRVSRAHHRWARGKGQGVKSRVGDTHSWCPSCFTLLQGRALPSLFAQCWESHESLPQYQKGELR